MRCIITSREDTASMNIRGKLLGMAAWTEGKVLFGSPTYWLGDADGEGGVAGGGCGSAGGQMGDAGGQGRGSGSQGGDPGSVTGMVLVTIPDHHIFHEMLDAEVRQGLGVELELIAFATRHKSVSNNRSLTVHPVGNYWKAEFGGRESSLPPSAPRWATPALRLLKKNAVGLDYSVSFEATHHGPWLDTPQFFIEIGSTEREWQEEKPAEAIARTLLGLRPGQDPIAIGIGGGHYMPRITDVALERKIAFGHMVPTYAIKGKAREDVKKAIQLAKGATAGCELAYIHRKGLGGELERMCRELAGELSLGVISSGELGLLAAGSGELEIIN